MYKEFLIMQLSSLVFLAGCQSNAFFIDEVLDLKPRTCEVSHLPFGNGDGSARNPYLICSIEHLNNISTQMSANFRLDRSLDYAGKLFSPIGLDDSDKFSGVFEGNHHSIINITYDNDADPYAVGFFRSLSSGAQVKNLILHYAKLTGNNFVGGVAGEADDATLDNITVSGTLKGNGSVGGVVGHSYLGKLFILNSKFQGSIWSTTNGSSVFHPTNNPSGLDAGVGGMLGVSLKTTEIINPHVEADITWDPSGVNQDKDFVFTGGIVGFGVARVERAYYKGNISGSWNVGGIAGFIGGYAASSRVGIYKSWVDGANIIGTQSSVSGLLGIAYSDSTERFSENIVIATITGLTNVGGFSGGGCGIHHHRSFAKINLTGVNVVGGGVGIFCKNGVFDSVVIGSVTGTGVSDSYYSLGGMGGAGYLECLAERSYTDILISAPNVTPAALAAGAVGAFGTYACTPLTDSIYYRTTTAGAYLDAEATGLSDAQMIDKNQFAGFDFTTQGVWRMPIVNPFTTLNSPVLSHMCGKYGIVCAP